MSIADKLRKIDRISTVFSIADIRILLGIRDKKSIYNAISYAVNQKELYKISDGIFALDMNYSKHEFANKYRKPSYISLYSVLQKAGVIFQPYTSVFATSNRSEKVEIDGQKYVYRKIKDDILLNTLGIQTNKRVQIATSERAICDKLYLDGDEYFDNLRNIDWELMKKINSDVYSDNQVITSFIHTYTNESSTYKKT